MLCAFRTVWPRYSVCIVDLLIVQSLYRTCSLDWLKALLSHDGSYENFCMKMQSVNSSLLCGCVWTAKFVAYRCRTCATSPCMSLCAGVLHECPITLTACKRCSSCSLLLWVYQCCMAAVVFKCWHVGVKKVDTLSPWIKRVSINWCSLLFSLYKTFW